MFQDKTSKNSRLIKILKQQQGITLLPQNDCLERENMSISKESQEDDTRKR
jgi:hypothetical protein